MSEAPTQGTPEPVYRLDAAARTYGSGAGRVEALRPTDLVLQRGDRLGIVGESGSGKTTLVKLLTALERPTAGHVHFEGTDFTGLAESRLGFLRSRVQLVFQDPRSSLNPRMKVGDIIAEPLRSKLLSHRRDTPRDRTARVTQLLDQVGLPANSARRYPHEFSGGQRQRIAIARALAPEPEVLIADEPVSALDVSVRAQVLNLLAELVEQMGLTMVFVSHDLMVVRHVCDRVLVMQSGEVVERGATAQVYAHPQHAYTRELLAAVPSLDNRRRRT